MKTFFWRPLQKNCVAASLETLREDPTVRVRNKQAVWKLLSKISRTAPVQNVSVISVPSYLADQELPTASTTDVTVESIASMTANIMMEEKEKY